MRLARVQVHDDTFVVLGDDEGRLRPVHALPGRAHIRDVADVIREPLTDIEVASLSSTPPIDLDDVSWLSPVRRTPKNVFCVGLNYLAHLPESTQMRSAAASTDAGAPVWFTKPWTSLQGHGQPLALAPDRTAVDYEGEVAAVIGSPCSHASAETALDYVFGYTIVNDISDRELQREREQWFLGKAGRGHAPCGPWIVTADEVGDPQKLHVRTTVSGEIRQEAQTSQMIHSFAHLIADLSAIVDLEPGDIIAGGTPAGVGMADGRYLKPGDEVSIAVDRLGVLTTPVVGSL